MPEGRFSQHPKRESYALSVLCEETIVRFVLFEQVRPGRFCVGVDPQCFKACGFLFFLVGFLFVIEPFFLSFSLVSPSLFPHFDIGPNEGGFFVMFDPC